MNISELRREYRRSELDEKSVKESPMDQFRIWFDQALKSDLAEPNAMVVSTVDQKGQPWQRSILLKAVDDDGLIFYTNYKSRKAGHLENNPHISLLFPWYILERQVAVTGVIEKVSNSQSLKYFLSRPRGSQLGAWVSHQSEIISSRGILEMKLAEMKRKFTEGKIPLPDFWGGYKVIPDSFEFWQGRRNRLHDRIMYTKEDQNWIIRRLSP